MSIVNTYTLNVDLKRKMTSVVPTFRQGDAARLKFKVFDDGKGVDISTFTRAEIYHSLSNGETLQGDCEIGDEYITYDYSGLEMQFVGFIKTMIVLRSGNYEASIEPFKVYIYDSMKAENLTYVNILQEMIRETQGLGVDLNQLMFDFESYDYSPAQAFTFPNLVLHNGSTYMALQDVFGIEPNDDKVNWRLVSLKGTVNTVNGVMPEGNGDIALTPSTIGAASSTELTQVEEALSTQLAQIVVNANVFASLQAAIDYCIANNKTLNISGMTFNLTNGLVIDGALKVTGDMSSTILDFSAVSSGVGITVANSQSINALVFDGARMIGNPSIIAIQLNGTYGRVITDSSFKNLRIQNFGVGLKGSYAWCNIFENVRFQGCLKPLELGSQFNNNDFNRCSFVSSKQPSTFSNCEGINFNSPNIANVQGDAFLLFQSNITLINPYYEYIEGCLAIVGQTTETYASSLVAVGGKSTDEFVKVGLKGNNALISLTGLNPSSHYVIDGQTVGESQGKSTPNLQLDEKPVEYVVKWDATSPIPFTPSYGGVVLTQMLQRGKFSKVSHATVNGGFQLANLTIGERYTLIYRLRKQSDSNVSVRMGNLPSALLTVATSDSVFETRYLPFYALESLLRLTWTVNTTLDIDFIGIVKGTVVPKELNKSQILMATAPPTTGIWQRGEDRIYNVNPTANGVEGWICTVSGAPGVWEPFGKIGTEVTT